MAKIEVLSKQVYNKIAAGEVVEKPASIIKELVENSLDAGAKNITIEIRKGGIEYISVTDDGCGIAKEDLKNIFDLFFRGTNSRLEKGMGIGLSVVKNIISTHGWTINVDSEKGVGSTFSIIIPLEQE